jgi:hypothetical protein
LRSITSDFEGGADVRDYRFPRGAAQYGEVRQSQRDRGSARSASPCSQLFVLRQWQRASLR